jgi:hypothetical protein
MAVVTCHGDSLCGGWIRTLERREGKAPFGPIFFTSRKNAGHDLAFAFAFAGRNTVGVLPMRGGMANDSATPPCLAYCIIHLTCRCLLNAECIQSVTPTNILCSLYYKISRFISDTSRKVACFHPKLIVAVVLFICICMDSKH